jgi:hypothetical protein|tara:strand:- start:778 stop:960 length:183 start_codon:yes stop_codon:yes gene_type:complete
MKLIQKIIFNLEAKAIHRPDIRHMTGLVGKVASTVDSLWHMWVMLARSKSPEEKATEAQP